jgi:hypothetical protein
LPLKISHLVGQPLRPQSTCPSTPEVSKKHEKVQAGIQF